MRSPGPSPRPRRREPRFRRAGAVLSLAIAAAALIPSPAAATESLAFGAEADTHVDASHPKNAYGKYAMQVDGSPVKRAFLRFRPSGLGERTVTRVRLRLYQMDASSSGGRVFEISATSWAESMTWGTQPAIDGPQVGAFGAVSQGAWYEIDLDPARVPGDGAVSLAIQSTNTDGVKWGSRESAYPPQLIVDVADSPPQDEGVAQVAGPTTGSTQPTYYPNNHRIAITSGGRLLTVFGRHLQGPQLAWRDPGGAWKTDTTGDVMDGLLLRGTGTGGWPASIAVARDPSGEEHGWVVWSAPNTNNPASLSMRRLSDLDAPAGPTVGPLVTVEAPGPGVLGDARPDIAFETAPDGSQRGCIVWLRRTGESAWELVTTWFTDLASDSPSFEATSVLLTSATDGRAATLTPAPGGLRLAARAASGKLQVFGHDAGAPLSTWWAGALGTSTTLYAYPSAVSLASGEVLVAVESDTTNHVVSVQRFSSTGAPVSVELRTSSGYAQPTIASDGSRAWLVMIRLVDGAVVSRQFGAGSGWDGLDRVEMGQESGGGYAWPNLLREAVGRLRFVVDGPAASSSQNAVLAYDRSF